MYQNFEDKNKHLDNRGLGEKTIKIEKMPCLVELENGPTKWKALSILT
jgi:hypothetical protein